MFILKEIQAIYRGQQVEVSTTLVDSNLYNELELDNKMANSHYTNWKTLSLDVFEYLKNNDQYVEAYTLLFKPHDLQEFGLNKMHLLQTLPIDTTKSVSFNYTDSITLLGHFDKDGAWHDSHIYWLDYPGP